MPPKRRFWKTEQMIERAISKYFTQVWVQDLGYESLMLCWHCTFRSCVFPAKIHTHAMTRWCVAFFGWMRLYLCKIFARCAYKNTHARAMTWRWHLRDECVCIFVKYLQDAFTKIHTHAMTARCVALSRVRRAVFKGLRRAVLKGVRRAVSKGVLKGVRRAVLKGVLC